MLSLLALACNPPLPSTPTPEPVEPVQIRVATFNVSMFGTNPTEINSRLQNDQWTRGQDVARILQEIRPDIVLINEIDRDTDGLNIDLLNDNFLAVGMDGAEGLSFEHSVMPTSNTGVHSGFDLDNDGTITTDVGSQAYGGDAYGFGIYEGQFAFAVLSRFPIENVRTFQETLWASMPDNNIPTDWYDADEQAGIRLSSKNHADVAITVGTSTLHFLVSHPTPPSFDGPEDRNGRRNHDEIKLWADYLDAGSDGWHVDDAGVSGGLEPGDHFVIAGDLNADPNDGDSFNNAIRQLTEHALVTDPAPESDGAEEQSTLSGGVNANHTTPSRQDTADFNDTTVGNLRIDYVLPSSTLVPEGGFTPESSGVFWPTENDPLFPLVGTFPFPGSDHRSVWVDLVVPQD